MSWFPLPVEFNLLGNLANTITGVTATPTSGGSFAAADYDWAVTLVKGTVESLFDAAAEILAETVALNEQVLVEWSDTSTPDNYRIYRRVNLSGDYTSPSLVGTVPGSVLNIVDEGLALSAGEPQTAGITVEIKSLDGITTYSDSTDYTLDLTNGRLKRITGTTIGDGEMVTITLTWAESARGVSVFDEGRFSVFHLPLMFVGQRSGLTSSGETDFVRIICDAVDWAKGGDSLTAFNELDDAGIPFELPVDYNRSTGRFGEIGIHDANLAGFTAISL